MLALNEGPLRKPRLKGSGQIQQSTGIMFSTIYRSEIQNSFVTILLPNTLHIAQKKRSFSLGVMHNIQAH